MTVTIIIIIAIILAIIGSRDPNRDKSYYKKNKPLWGLIFALASLQCSAQYHIENSYFISLHNNDTMYKQAFVVQIDSHAVIIQSEKLSTRKLVQLIGRKVGNEQRIELCDAHIDIIFEYSNLSIISHAFFKFKSGECFYFPNK